MSRSSWVHCGLEMGPACFWLGSGFERVTQISSTLVALEVQRGGAYAIMQAFGTAPTEKPPLLDMAKLCRSCCVRVVSVSLLCVCVFVCIACFVLCVFCHGCCVCKHKDNDGQMLFQWNHARLGNTKRPKAFY